MLVDLVVFIGYWRLSSHVVLLSYILQVAPFVPLFVSIYSFVCLQKSLVSKLFVSICSQFWPSLPLGANMTGMSQMLLSSPVFWLGLFLAPVAALLSDFSIKT